MKLQSEIFWIGFSAVILSLVIVMLLNYSSQISKSSHYIFRSSVSDDLNLRSISILYISKIPTLEKTYLQVAIDALASLRKLKENEGEKVKEEGMGNFPYYGIALGAYNASDLIYSVFDNYIGKGRWQLILYYDKNLYEIYGYEIKGNEIKSYVLPIPIPDEEVGYLVLRVA